MTYRDGKLIFYKTTMRILGDFKSKDSCRNNFKTLTILTILLLFILETCCLFIKFKCGCKVKTKLSFLLY